MTAKHVQAAARRRSASPPKIEDRPHSRVSPSGYERISRCTKSLVLTAQAPPATTGVDAAVGTAAHDVLERCLRYDLDTYEIKTGPVLVDGHVVQVDDAMLEGVQLALDWIRAELEPPLVVEQRVELGFAGKALGEPMFGYIDAGAMRPVPTIADFKNGAGVVPADAPQLKLYLLGFLHDHGVIPKGKGVAGRTVVIQPNAQAEPIRVAEHTGDELRAFAAEVVEVMERIARRDFTYEAGSWCRWCAGAAICPHLAAVARDAALARITPSPELVASGEFNADMLNEALNLISSVDAWVRAVTRTAEDYLLHGGKLPDWKLVRKRVNRRWKDSEPEILEKLKALGIDPLDHKLVTPAEAERRLPPGRRKAVEGLAEKPVGDLTLARADDVKPGVEVAATLKRALEGSVAAGFLALADARDGRMDEPGGGRPVEQERNST